VTTNHHTAIATGAAANAGTFNSPLSQLDAALPSSGTIVVLETSQTFTALQLFQRAISTVFANAVPSQSDTLIALSNTQASESAYDHASIQFVVNGGTYNRIGSVSFVAESAANRRAGIAFAVDNGTTRPEVLRIDSNGRLGLGTSAPGSPVELNLTTEDVEIVDAGSAGASAQDWIEVQVGGVTGYLRVYSTK